jgi:import inner membrane translocase subunit TIM50
MFYEIKKNPKGTLGNLYYGSELENFFNMIYKATWEPFSEVFEPVSDKLIPDWPTDPYYGGQIPEGQPAPPLLILDLERTLIGSTYDAANGWRHVKRPGLDIFIETLCKYYEVVIFSENDLGLVDEILVGIDPKGQCLKLGSAHAELKDGVLIKRLDYMNRDLAKVLLIDDNPAAFQLQPENAIQVKPYIDVHDQKDTTLLELLPFLLALVHDDVKDYRKCLNDLRTHDAEDIVAEYQMRLAIKKEEENMKRNKGLGGIIRKKNTEKNVYNDDSIELPSSSISKIVGGTPNIDDTKSENTNSTIKPISKISKGPSTKKKGGFFQWFDDYEKEKEETEKRRHERMIEIHTRQQREKIEKEKNQKQQE